MQDFLLFSAAFNGVPLQSSHVTLVKWSLELLEWPDFCSDFFWFLLHCKTISKTVLLKTSVSASVSSILLELVELQSSWGFFFSWVEDCCGDTAWLLEGVKVSASWTFCCFTFIKKQLFIIWIGTNHVGKFRLSTLTDTSLYLRLAVLILTCWEA